MMFIRIVFLIYSIFLIQVQSSFARFGDWDVGLRCEESYKLDSICYPSDATLNDDGSCSCPPGGCSECAVHNGIKDYYCYFPINILSQLDNENLPLKGKVNLHYKHLLAPDRCGKNNIDYKSIFNTRYEGKDKNTKFETLKNENVGEGESLLLKNESLVDITEYQQIALNPNGYYGLLPRIEKISGTNDRILRMYFTQADKLERIQVGENDKYFHFKKGDFTEQKINTEGGFDSVGKVWRAINYCEKFNDRWGDDININSEDEGDDKGRECINSSYIKGLLLYNDEDLLDEEQDDYNQDHSGDRVLTEGDLADGIDRDSIRHQALGLKVPNAISEIYFPSIFQENKGVSYVPIYAPNISWDYKDDSTFIYPKVTVKFSDRGILDNCGFSSGVTCKDINILERIENNAHPVDENSGLAPWEYSLYSRVEQENGHDQVNLCIYACLKKYVYRNNPDAEGVEEGFYEDKCLYTIKDDSDEEQQKSLEGHIESSPIHRVKAKFLVESSCKPFNNNMWDGYKVEISGREANSNDVANQKVKVTLRDKNYSASHEDSDNNSITAEIGVSDLDHISNFTSGQFFLGEDNNYIKNKYPGGHSAKLFRPFLFSVKQELESGYGICKNYNYKEGQNDIEDISCSSTESFPYQSSPTKYNNYDDINNNKNYLCIHNLLPHSFTGYEEGSLQVFNKVNPYFINFTNNENIISNDSYLERGSYIERKNRRNNLCVPSPYELGELCYLETDNADRVELKLRQYYEPYSYILDDLGNGFKEREEVIMYNGANNNTDLNNGGLNFSSNSEREYNYDYYNKFRISKNADNYSFKKYNYVNNAWDSSQELKSCGCPSTTRNGYSFTQADFGSSNISANNSKNCGRYTVGRKTAKYSCDREGSWRNFEEDADCDSTPKCKVKLKRENGGQWYTFTLNNNARRKRIDDLNAHINRDNQDWNDSAYEAEIEPGCVLLVFDNKQQKKCITYAGNDNDSDKDYKRVNIKNKDGEAKASSIEIYHIKDYIRAKRNCENDKADNFRNGHRYGYEDL